MTASLPIFISAASLLLALYVFLSGHNEKNTTELTTVIVKLENISLGIADIKTEITALRNDQKDDHERLIKLEASVNTAWKRIDELKKDANL